LASARQHPEEKNCFLVALVSLGSQAQKTRTVKRTSHLEGAAFFVPRAHAHAALVRRQAAERDVRPWGRVPSNWTVQRNN